MCDSDSGLWTTFYQSAGGLMPLVQLAVGPSNYENIDPNITQERFPFSTLGTGVRKLFLRVEPCLKLETINMTVERLLRAGHTLEGTGELAGFLHEHPAEVERWNWVFAVPQKQERHWLHREPNNNTTRVAGASVVGNYKRFWRCFDPRLQGGYDAIDKALCGILVSNPER